MLHETEEQMVARIEAEERARMEFEDIEQAHAAGLGPASEMEPAADETEGQLRRRIEAEERARLDDSNDGHLVRDPIGARCCRRCCDSTLRFGAKVPLVALAKRFAWSGVTIWGGPAEQVAQLGAQHWAAVDEVGVTSLLALIECLPGPTPTQLAAALGLLHGGVCGGVVAAVCFAGPSILALATLGSAAHAALGGGALLAAMAMGLAAAAHALVTQAALAAVGMPIF